MAEQTLSADIIVIGAGLSGVTAARHLQAQGKDVLVLDKGRSAGGRMATRRVGAGVADHGAQFFTVREPEFQTYVDQWLEEGLVFVWSYGWGDGSLVANPSDGHPRYAVRGGLSQLPKTLALDLNRLHVQVEIATATRDEQGWILQDQEGNLFTCNHLILTPPVPQTIQLLDNGATELAANERAILERISYAPCLAGMFLVDGQVNLPSPGAIQRKNSNVHWIADNRAKGISPDATVITVHANERYSRQMWDASDEHILSALRSNLQLFMDAGANIVEEQLKRWRYSAVLVTHSERYLVTNDAPHAIFAGDAFGGPRVEGAFLSGMAAARALLDMLDES